MDYPVLLHRYHIRLYGRVILSRMAIQIKTLSEVRAHILQRPQFRDRGLLFGRNFAMAAAMFMNSNSLPIALMQSLVVTVPGLKWDDDDNEDAMVGRALTYLVLHSTLGMVVRSRLQCGCSCIFSLI